MHLCKGHQLIRDIQTPFTALIIIFLLGQGRDSINPAGDFLTKLGIRLPALPRK